MKRTYEFILWFISGMAVVMAFFVRFHHLFKTSTEVANLFALAAVVLVAFTIAYEKWLCNVRFASSGFKSRVPGHEGMCFHYFGPAGFVQSARHLFGPLYYMDGKTFMGVVDGREVKPYF